MVILNKKKSYCRIKKPVTNINEDDVDKYLTLRTFKLFDKPLEIISGFHDLVVIEFKHPGNTRKDQLKIPGDWVEECQLSTFDRLLIDVNENSKGSIETMGKKFWNTAIDECYKLMIDAGFIDVQDSIIEEFETLKEN